MKILLAMLALLIVTGFKPEPTASNHYEKKPESAGTESRKAKEVKPGQPTVIEQNISNCEPCAEKSEPEKQRAAKQSHGWLERMNAGSTAIIAIFAVVTAIAIVYQVKTARSTERAWMLVKRVGNPPEDWPEQVKSGYVPGIVFDFGVFGNTPARVTDARFKLCSVPAKSGVTPPEPDLPDPPDYTGAVTNPSVKLGNMLPPTSGEMQVRVDIQNLKDEQVAELRDERTFLCAYGFIKYNDAFNRERETATCYVYRFAWGGIRTSPDGTVLNPAGFRPGGPRSYHRAT